MKSLFQPIISFVYDYICLPTYFFIVYFRDLNKIHKAYGEFESMSKADIIKYTLRFEGKAKNVCGLMVGEMMKSVMDLPFKPKHIYLDGDNSAIKKQFKQWLDLPDADIVTAGYGKEYDFFWDYENDPPKKLPGNYDLIISQSIVEHLIDPYKHFVDLAKLLKKGGVIMFQTDMPGFTYHRFPIDTLRFFPDWFEAVGKKLNLKVIRRFQRDFNVIYVFQKIK